MKQLIPLFVLLTLASCTASSESVEPAPADIGFHSYKLTADLDCEPSLGVLGCLSRNEPSAAEQHDVELARADGVLCLSSPGATKVCLPEKDGLSYAFLERTSGNLVVVETVETEGYTVLMVSEKTRRQGRIDNRPLFSPGAPFFATVSYDTDAGYLPNRVAIWDSTTNALLYEVDRFASGTGPIGIRWLAPTRLEVLYSRSEYSPARDENADPFSIWRNEKNTWADDYRVTNPTTSSPRALDQ